MRIRTIKPEFFTHEELWETERETGLPIRIAFAGLWCCADREGRFKWEPRRLGVQILPYDNLDFSRVLHALTTRGFVVKYRVNDACFGCIPSFSKHQIVNNREALSVFPSIEQGQVETVEKEQVRHVEHASPTRQPRVRHASKAEGKGKEQEGNGTEGDCVEATREIEKASRPRDLVWDALTEAVGSNGAMSDRECAKIGKAVKDLKALMPDKTAEEIAAEVKRRSLNYPLLYPGATFTEFALLSHWSRLDVVQPVLTLPGAPASHVNGANGTNIANVASDAVKAVSPNVLIIQWTKELDDCQEKLDSIKDSYDGHQDWTIDDVNRYNRILGRKKELKKLLDRKV